ncbi:MAG: pantoate--beta-alanine ligase, partial [Pseudobdellovibrionaceae bacterium]
MTQVIRSPQEFKQWRREQAGKTLGFVPTMGALHAGHESLLKRCREENEICVLSVFVNPTQFNDPKDFEKYPLTWDQDLALAEKNGVDVIFYPRPEEMYPDGYHYKIT